MAWSSHGGGQQSLWQASHNSFAQYPVAARQRPCDIPAYAYSWALHTNNGDYLVPTHPPIAPPHRRPEPEWLQESRKEDEAREPRREQRAIYPPPLPQLSPPQPRVARTTIRAAAIDTEEEAARQALSAATPPPAQPARSAARTQPPPIPPRSTRPRIDTGNDTRVEVHARNATWQEPLPARPSPPPARPPSPPARPPPRPARAAARQSMLPTRCEHPPDEPPHAMSARATSPGVADRTAPTNDRSLLPSKLTATAPPTRPLPSTAASPPSQALPPPPTRLYSPRAPPINPNRRVSRTDSSDVLQDTAYLRAIEEYAQEGGEEREKRRGDGGEDALARSVRGTPIRALQRADRDFSRDHESSPAVGLSARTYSTPTTLEEVGRFGCAEQGAVTTSRSPRPSQEGRESARPASAHISPDLPPSRPSPPESPPAPPSLPLPQLLPGARVPPPHPLRLIARGVRGAQPSASQRTDCRTSCVSASPRASGTPAEGYAKAADTPTRNEHGRAQPAVHHLTRMDERQRVPPVPVSTASRTTTRVQDGCTTTSIPCRPPRSIVAQQPSPPPPLHQDYGAKDGTRESEYPRGMAIPSTRETAATQNARARPAPTPTRHVSMPKAPPHIANRDFLRNHTPSRAGRTSTSKILAPAVAIEDVHRSGRVRAVPVPAPLLPPPRHIDAGREGQDSSALRVAYANGSSMKISSERGVAHSRPIATPSSTFLAPQPLQPDSSSAAHPLRRSPADARAPPPRPVWAAARSSDARTVQPVPAPECAIGNAGLMCGGTRPNGSLPHVRMATHHPPASTTPYTGWHGRMEDFASLATAESSQEYTAADGVRLAGASSQERGEGLSRALRVEARANSTCPNMTATAHPRQVSLRPPPRSIIQPPPPRMPPPLPLCPPATPPGWPFPISIEEMGWVLTAVVMARRMDQEDEQRQREDGYDYDYDHFDLQRDETDTGVAHDLERGASSPEQSAHGGDVFGSDTMATLHEQEHDEYADSFNPASSVSSPVASIDIEHDDANSWESEEASLHLSDQLDEDFDGSDWSEDQYWQDEVVGDV